MMDEVSGLAMTKTYSLTMMHIAKVNDMAQNLGISQGEVVRQAIDLLWEKTFSEAAAPSPTPTA